MAGKHGDSTCRQCETIWSTERQQKCSKSLEGCLNWRLISLRSRAKKRGLEFNLTPEDLVARWNEQDGKCFYSGRPLKFGSARNHELSKDDLSVDRVDPQRGYVLDNIVFCTRHVNTMKSDLSIEEFSRLLREIGMRKEIWNAKHPSQTRQCNVGAA